jgi:hypothetical protein
LQQLLVGKEAHFSDVVAVVRVDQVVLSQLFLNNGYDVKIDKIIYNV